MHNIVVTYVDAIRRRKKASRDAITHEACTIKGHLINAAYGYDSFIYSARVFYNCPSCGGVREKNAFTYSLKVNMYSPPAFSQRAYSSPWGNFPLGHQAPWHTYSGWGHIECDGSSMSPCQQSMHVGTEMGAVMYGCCFDESLVVS